MKKKVLVTGGAGYIGSHTVQALVSAGYETVVLDNLVYGHAEAVDQGRVTLAEGDVGDAALLERLFNEHDFAAVLHFAAYAYVGESVTQPIKYYKNNTAAPLVLLETMVKHGCPNFIFSSTCATYGEPEEVPIRETEKQDPINPYGRSKLMLEWVLRDCGEAHDLRAVNLRYFNASGAAADGSIGEDHDPETHLIPLVLMTLTGERENITVFGDDYDTPDGTCIRDYIHVEDLADAHVKALIYLLNGGESTSCNLGTGEGVSVREIIEKAEDVTGRRIPAVMGERREGDPPRLVADPSKAKDVLGWEARHKDVRDAIRDAWTWMSGERKGRF